MYLFDRITLGIIMVLFIFSLLMLCSAVSKIYNRSSKNVQEMRKTLDEVKAWDELVKLDKLKRMLFDDLTHEKIDIEMYKKSRLFLTNLDSSDIDSPSTYALDDGVVVFDWNGVLFKRMDQ